MDNVYHLFGKLRNFSSLESLEVLEFFGWNTVCIIHVTLIDNIFRAERISHFFFELFKDIRTDRCGVTEPVYIFFSRKLIKDQGKLMEKCRKTYYIHILMRIKETTETLQGMCSCLRLTHIKSDLRLYVLPVIYDSIIHMNRVPHDICQKADRIFMKKFRRCDHDISTLFVIRPPICRNDFACGTVNDFPPSGDIITGIYFQHVRVEMVHKVDLKFLLRCCMERTHDVHLLDLIRVCLCPCIIFSCCIISSVDLCTCVFEFCRELCSIAVTNRICAPFLYDIQCFFYHIQVCRDRNSAFVLTHRCTSVLYLWISFIICFCFISDTIRIRCFCLFFNVVLAILFRNLAVFYLLCYPDS